MSKNVLKWYFTWTINDYYKPILIILLFFVPIVKFIFIGRENLVRFSEKFKNNFMFSIMLLIIAFECFFEMPCHFFFPRNIIYLHTNYHRIYDLPTFRKLECRIEIIENLILEIFVVQKVFSTDFSVTPLLLFILCNIFLVYFLVANLYFFFFNIEEQENGSEKDFYGVSKQNPREQQIPYEIKRLHKYTKNNEINNMNNSNSSNDSKEEMISNKINLNGECERNTLFEKK